MNSDVKNFDFEILNSLPDMYFLLNIKGEIEDLNNCARELIDIKKNVGAISFNELIESCDRGKANEKFLECISKKISTDLETRFYLNGTYTNVNISFSFPVLKSNSRNEDFVIACVRDITAEKNKMIDLQRFFNIVENSINPVQITDLNGKMIYVNPAFVRASGYSK